MYIFSFTFSMITVTFFFFLPYHKACGILVPQPGIEAKLPAVEAPSLNHWTAKEVPALAIPCA